MMYDEFLALGGERVKHITFIEYATFVEPLFEEMNIWKEVFIERLLPLLDEIEASTVNDVINKYRLYGQEEEHVKRNVGCINGGVA